VVAKGYLSKLLANAAVKSYIERNEPEILSHLALVANIVSMEEAVQQGEPNGSVMAGFRFERRRMQWTLPVEPDIVLATVKIIINEVKLCSKLEQRTLPAKLSHVHLGAHWLR